MRRFLLIAYCLTVVVFASDAQTYADSLMLTYVRWVTMDLGDGLTWKSYHFNQKELFASNQHVSILQTKLKNNNLKFALGSADMHTLPGDTLRKLKLTSTIASENYALAAVNGGFFNTKRGGAVDFIKINKKILDSASFTPDRIIPEHSVAAITIDDEFRIVKGGSKLYWEKSLPQKNVLVTGPLLIYNNEEQELRINPFNNNRHPRTCACVTKDDDLMLITVDGRNANAQGMTLHELTYMSRMLGCKDAINLDGGGSTTMYIKGQPFEGVVNFPCDNKQFDHSGERAVSNILMILKK